MKPLDPYPLFTKIVKARRIYRLWGDLKQPGLSTRTDTCVTLCGNWQVGSRVISSD